VSGTGCELWSNEKKTLQMDSKQFLMSAGSKFMNWKEILFDVKEGAESTL